MGVSLAAGGAEGASFEHARLTGIVIDDVRLVYIPVPKAATTSILSALAELVGVDPRVRLRSTKLEATRGTTIHDGSLWPARARLGRRSDGEVEEILTSDEWFRFTVVREPAARIWSAWVTKVLVRDPRFLASFEPDLFPAPPTSADDVLAAFRRFVCSLLDRPDLVDSHWSSQAELVGIAELEYGVVGRVERLQDLRTILDRYLRDGGRRLPSLKRENPSFLPFDPGVFDREAHEICVRWTARDCAVFGYDPLDFARAGPGSDWYASVEAALPAIQAVIERNERLLDVWRLREADRERKRHPRWELAASRAKSHRVLVPSLAALLLAATLIGLPEALGDRPFDPRPTRLLHG